MTVHRSLIWGWDDGSVYVACECGWQDDSDTQPEDSLPHLHSQFNEHLAATFHRIEAR